MRSGLDADDDDASSPGNENTLDASSDWIRTVYAVPMKLTPRAKYVYCSLNAFLTGAIVENVSHMPRDWSAHTLASQVAISDSDPTQTSTVIVVHES
jgi:CubicO group peptidase (beta-lactamase class C family)